MERYKLQKSRYTSNSWVCTDTVNNIVITWEEGKFNETQKVTPLDDTPPASVMAAARAMREITDWLINHHQDIL